MLIGKTPLYDPAHLIHVRTATVQELFAHGDVGMVVPHHYRQFVWGEAKVSQFVGDICRCVTRFVDDCSAVHCFGAITLVRTAGEALAVQHLNPFATPRNLFAIVDGQQRLATLALVASRVYWRLHELRSITYEDEYSSLRTVFDEHMDALLHICAFNLRSGFPSLKPVLIHGRFDIWHGHDPASGGYESAVSAYLGQFLLTLATDATKLPAMTSSLLTPHIAIIDRWLDVITAADNSGTEAYVTAWAIRSGLHYLDHQLFSHPAISAAAAGPVGNRDSASFKLCTFIHLWAFAYTLLRRCCFVVITPTTERALAGVFETRRYEMAIEEALASR